MFDKTVFTNNNVTSYCSKFLLRVTVFYYVRARPSNVNFIDQTHVDWWCDSAERDVYPVNASFEKLPGQYYHENIRVYRLVVNCRLLLAYYVAINCLKDTSWNHTTQFLFFRALQSTTITTSTVTNLVFINLPCMAKWRRILEDFLKVLMNDTKCTKIHLCANLKCSLAQRSVGLVFMSRRM